MKRMVSKLNIVVLFGFLFILAMLSTTTSVVQAQYQTVTDFTSGSTASASAVNNNFTFVEARLFDLYSGNNIYWQGEIGINETTPDDPLHVRGDSGNDNIRLEEYSGGEYWRINVDSAGNLDFEDETRT